MKIIVTNEYEEDIKKIVEYIRKEDAPSIALQIEQGFLDKYFSIKNHPWVYPLSSVFGKRNEYWKSFPFKRWNIFFYYNKEKDLLIFSRIIDQSRSQSTIYKMTRGHRNEYINGTGQNKSSTLAISGILGATFLLLLALS